MSDTFKFDEKKHVYTLDGKRLYGVTSVLGVIAKPALIAWSAKMVVEYIKENCTHQDKHYLVTELELDKAKLAHRKKKEAAGEKGTDIHALCETYIKLMISDQAGKALPMNDYADPMVQKFVEWAVANDVTFLASEKKMYSKEMWIAGCCDFTAKIGDKLFMGDIKTSSGIYGREYFFQCAGYILMAEEHGEKFDASIIVRLGKDGSFETKESHDLDTDKKGFRAALDLFKALETFNTK